MKVLFLGNSYTYFNDLPGMVQWLAEKAGLDVQTESVTRGGAYLHQFADPADELFVRWQKLYTEEEWDAVVLQNQSFHPVKDPESFRRAAMDVQALCRTGQKIVFYQTWAYKFGSEKLAGTGMTYGEMLSRMTASYAGAAEAVGGITVPVGQTFAEVRALHPEIELYNPDGSHPSPAGTYLAACLFLSRLTDRSPLYFAVPETVPAETGGILRCIADWQLSGAVM